MRNFLNSIKGIVTGILWVVLSGLPAFAAQDVKTVNGLAIASVKTVHDLAIASVKTVMGLDNTAGGGAPAPGILWLKCNEGSGTTVSAFTGTGCTNFNGTWNAAGSGSSIQGNGTSQSMSSSSAINYASNQIITVSFWIKAASYSNAGVAAQVWFESTTSWSGGSNTWSIYNDVNSNFNKILVGVNDNASNSSFFGIARPTTGVWHNFVIVLNNTAGTCTAWKNGVTETVTNESVSFASAGAFSTQTLYYLARNNASSWAPVQLDDIQIHAGALNGTQAAAINTAGQQ